MQNLFSMLLVAFMVVLYILISLPVILAQKIYRKARYGTSIWN